MSAIAFLLGLLVLSYMGSMLIGGRTVRGFGLPSGVEYLVLGFVLGPHVLSVVTRAQIETFQPLVVCGVGWLGLVVGASYLPLRSMQQRAGRLFAGAMASLAVVCIVALGVYVITLRTSLLSPGDALVFALAAGMVAAETTRYSVRWVTERYRARPGLVSLASDFARSSVWVPALVLGLLNAFVNHAALPSVPALGRLAVNLALGVVLGTTAALLLGREFRRHESWGLLLGASLLGMGAAVQLGLSPFTAMMAMGVTLAAVSPHRLEIKAMVQPTEKPVLLPVLVLTGAYVDVALPLGIIALLGLALALKLVARLVVGLGVAALVPAARGAGLRLGLGMMSAGGVSVAAALGFVVRHPGLLGDAVLLLATVATLVGEVMGPTALRSALGSDDRLPAVEAAS